MGKRCVGVDVGGTSVKLGLFELTGEVVCRWEIPTRREENGRNILPDVAASIKQVLAGQQIDLADVVGVGLGVPGPVMENGYVEVCVNLGWRNLSPAEELSRILNGMPVKIGNDANVAALGEMWQGGGKGYADVVMVTLGTGVGGGVILNEKIVAGKRGLAGEIGHIHVRDEETEVCNCGGIGCLEQIASATGIAREAKRKLAAGSGESVMRQHGDEITAKDVLDAAKAGDTVALEVVDTVGRYLGLILSQLTMTIDPERFVIGGGVSKAGTFLINIIEQYYDQYTPISKNKGTIGLAELGNDAGIYGAARMILE